MKTVLIILALYFSFAACGASTAAPPRCARGEETDPSPNELRRVPQDNEAIACDK